MQPTYLPWLGYFDLIDQVDCFVFLDSIQFSKRSWQQRNRIKGHSGAQWLSVPVLSKGKRDQLIQEVEIDLTASFHQKHLETIRHLYSNAPFTERYYDDLSIQFQKDHALLADLNIDLISWLCHVLGIETKFLRSSSLNVKGSKTELLVDICKAVKADRYISPPGSKEYIEENNIFADNGISLGYQNFCHPEYAQLHGEFVPYLSAMDLLLNEGPFSLEIIRAGRA